MTSFRNAVKAATIVAGLGWATGAQAGVQENFHFSQDDCSGECLPNAQDNVTVTQKGANLDFVVTLFGGDGFNQSHSGQHDALAFDIDKSSISLSSLTSGFSLVSSSVQNPLSKQDGLGYFGYLIDSASMGPTALSFELVGLSLSDITADSKGYYFSLDMSAADGNAGNIGSNSYIAMSAPEPSTWAMLLLGCAGLGYAARRRRMKPPLEDVIA